MADVTAIILTKNEEKNISECLESVKDFVSRAVIIDSGSSDETVNIAKRFSFVDVMEHPFENYARQFNWGLDNSSITTKWTLRLDADERFTPELCRELTVAMDENQDTDINGFVLEAWLYFMGRKLLHGGSRKKKLMVFKTGLGRIEDRKMDEHTILLEGQAKEIKEKFLHFDFKDIDTYVKKLNWYATREMQDYFEDRFPQSGFDGSNREIQNTRKNKSKYYKAPMFIRCLLYFLYCFIFKGEILNGREGRIYSFLYQFYYRMLVDIKIYEQMKFPKEFEKTGDLK